MIFQVPIDIEIEYKTVQAIIDLDTGFIGFTELGENGTKEYLYGESPIEFKKALIKKLELIMAEKNLVNFKVCGKNENMKFIEKYLKNSK